MNLFFLSLHWIPTIFLVLIFTLSLSFLLKQRKVKKAANLPQGPSKLPIIGNLHQIGNGNHHSLWNLSKKYGPAMLLQLGRNQVLVISSPQMAKEVLKNHDVECCTKPKLHAQKKLTYNFLTIAFSSYNDSWRQMRKLFTTELFTKIKIQSFECTRKVNVTQLIDSIAQNSPNSIDLSEKALTLTYSIICHTAFSRDYEEIEGGKLKELNEEAMQTLGIISTVDILPWLGGIVDAIMGLSTAD